MSEIDKKYIESRVNDWVNRIEDLYSTVKKALSDSEGIECKSVKHMMMHEGLMRNFGVLPKKIPILDLYKNKNLIASFKPVGLWVIGANGRIDILTKSGSFIVVDVAEQGNESEWKVFTPNNRKKGLVFDSASINKLVSV
ncbi:hypothetical protein QUF75_14275 [Desulfococcaceae bacterium HSG7]|nr:hypothetical protein [Desulfococcaceae bacterium HSG7]